CHFLATHAPEISAVQREARAADLAGALSLTGLVVLGPITRWLHASLREYLAAQHLVAEFPPSGDEACRIVARWDDETWRGLVIIMVVFWSQIESRGEAGRAPLTARLLASLLYSDERASSSLQEILSQVSSWFSGKKKDDARPLRSRAATAFALEVLAETPGIDPSMISRIVAELASFPNRLISFGACARVFKSGREELDALMRWRGRLNLLKLLDPLIGSMEQFISNANVDDASGALAFIGWIGRDDRLRAL